MTEYERRLNAWARTLTDQTFPDNDKASVEAYCSAGCDTCGPESSIDVWIGDTLVREFGLYELPTILAGIVAVAYSEVG